jgi:hypothetical protein
MLDRQFRTIRVCRCLPTVRRAIVGTSLVLLAVGAVLFLRQVDRNVAAAPPVARPVANAGSATPVPKPDTFKTQVAPLLQKYCIECHGPQKQKADLALHKYPDAASAIKDRGTWESVLEMIESSAMPPEGQPQPTAAERQLLIKSIESVLFNLDCDLPRDPGRVTIRRLNRAEYNNTVRDLLGVDFRPADNFPSDDVGNGFDNMGDVLSLPPLLFEKYMDAAEQVARAAVAAASPTTASTQRREKNGLVPEGGAKLSGNIYSISSTGAVHADFDFPRSGEYALRAQAVAQQAGPDVARMEVRLDGKAKKVFEVRATREAPQTYELRLQVEKGKHRLAAAFINDYYNPTAKDPKDRDRNLYVAFLEVAGPLDVPVPSVNETPAVRRPLVIVQPGTGKSVKDAARETLNLLICRAFRRRLAPDEVDRFAGLVELAVGRGDSYERGIEVAVSAVLVSPQFLFRVERDADPNDPKAKHTLGDYELASRLSYFLWSSMPDDDLFALATKGTLHQDDVLQQQIRRMLADPKSRALAENFGSQWLNLRGLAEVSPDPQQFGSFNDQLLGDMRRETEMFFEAVMRDDRSVLSFLDGDFTFVNERLARHYGMTGVAGEQFRRVSLAGTQRAGVLTQASVLTLTSNPTRTSPVKRGKWIMENILGTPPPEPPADVPLLEDTQKAAPNASLREQLELHRKDPNCAVCHRQMDALGFGFENFDPIGRWRDRDGKFAIDASGTLPSGDKFSGPIELVKILKQRKAEFGRSLTEKMLTYALGRGLEFHDRCAVDKIVGELEKNDYRFSILVSEIVNSEPFRMRRGEGARE